MSGDLSEVTHETFQPLINTVFTATTDGVDGEGTFRLVEVELDVVRGGPRAQPFRLVFDGPTDALWPQQIYRLEHGDLGQLDVFMGPVESGTYEAVFN